MKGMLDYNNWLNSEMNSNKKNCDRRFKIRIANSYSVIQKNSSAPLSRFKSRNSATRNLPKSDTGLKCRGIISQHDLKFGKLQKQSVMFLLVIDIFAGTS